jgi:hypothetical protein
VVNPTNTTDSSALEFALSSLFTAFDEQYEGIPDDEIALLVRKFRVLHKFHKERRSPRGCFKCDDTTHFITDCPKRKKLDSPSNKYDYTKRNNYSKGDDKKKYRSGDKKKLQKMMSQRVLPSVTSTSPATAPPAQRRMRGPSARHATSLAFASWANLRDTSPTLTPM